MTEEILLSVPATTTLPEHAVRSIRVTPVAFKDPPLLNTVGVHEPLALRAIIQMSIESGATGLGEIYGDEAHIRLAVRRGKHHEHRQHIAERERLFAGCTAALARPRNLIHSNRALIHL